ncbi:MAG: hypothetical protein A3J37_05260 [Alphaproteobacteria bacterium RIFCSPHIGHO2_12_FULL_45_9]|nr:MAG: hypothetical protein A3B66_01730 [Alphaproteobacteria bacterium RIFCSPHIGHO2_02_FULL_46_13]OFW94054.1 MAG: hypothetical protein A3J37_05260 [Alphaproteobacteria bacterium RIFCSPHIGHO2_12_FULL_45_9]
MVIISAFIVVLGFIPLICKLADRAGFVDKPDGRKQHDKAVPPLGGAVIFTTFLTYMMIFGSMPWAVFAALALILVLGIVDDAWEVNATLKFLLHFLAAFMLVIGGGAQIHSLGNLLGFGDIHLWWLAIPFSVACVVYIQNAVNMMDGVDGLAGGYSFLVFAWLMLAEIMAFDHILNQQILILMACLGGFLVYNMRSPFLKNAKIFLGDAGSMALGLMIAWYAITLTQGQFAIMKPVSVAWIIALPIFDSFALLVTRIRAGHPPFKPDRRHFHHHFANAGFTPGQTTALILSYSALLGAIGFFGIKIGVPEYILGWGWVALWMGHTVLTLKSEKFIQLLVAVRARIQRQ